jgi:O-acetyl-ADP-ribose deacetylase (regulator of RNase III)
MIEVVHADITKLDVDAIVNAANSSQVYEQLLARG